MSLFIKCNICLPQGCKSCPFNYTDVCIASNKGIDTRAFVHIRHPDCPMVEIPTPHGRLIDAEKLYKKFKNEYCNRNCDSSIQGKQCDHCGVPRALNIILNAPTIIEAEGVNE